MTASAAMDWKLIAGGVLWSVEALSRVAASSAVSELWQGAVLAAGAGLCLRIVPKTTAAMRFALWSAVFGVLALLPLLPMSLWHTSVRSSGRGAMMHVDARWSLVIAGLWMVLSAVRAVDLAVGAVKLRGIGKRAVPVGGSALEDSFAALDVCGLEAAGAAVRLRGVELCTSGEVDRPNVIGFVAPRILIPRDMFSRLTATELEQIVLHELGHLERADQWWNLMQKLGLVLFPLNPALIWIERRLCLERELACDDNVLRRTKAPKAYATCLTSLAERRLGRRAAALSLGAWERQSQLACRVHRILLRGDAMSPRLGRLVLGTLAVGLLGGAAELARYPQVVSFTAESGSVASEAQGLAPVGFQPVVFRPAAHSPARELGMTRNLNGAGSAREVLLKASMPGAVERKRTNRDLSKQRPGAAHGLPAGSGHVLRAKLADRGRLRQRQAWLVLSTSSTSWSDWSAGRVEAQPAVFAPGFSASSAEQEFFPSYAAVPTEAGWLIIQL